MTEEEHEDCIYAFNGSSLTGVVKFEKDKPDILLSWLFHQLEQGSVVELWTDPRYKSIWPDQT